jgi:hypothetical protein
LPAIQRRDDDFNSAHSLTGFGGIRGKKVLHKEKLLFPGMCCLEHLSQG